MISILLRAAAPYIMVYQSILSLFFLLRGHNLPGGGFIGGLLVASAFVFYTIAYDVRKARKILGIAPERILGLGLLVAFASGLFALGTDKPYMSAEWFGSITLPGMGKVSLGTPFLFDVGVYLVVHGMVTSVVFSLYGKNKASPENIDREGG